MTGPTNPGGHGTMSGHGMLASLRRAVTLSGAHASASATRPADPQSRAAVALFAYGILLGVFAMAALLVANIWILQYERRGLATDVPSLLLAATIPLLVVVLAMFARSAQHQYLLATRNSPDA